MEPPNLPEDIVTEILLKFPTLHLLKFRRVCERWKDLISTQYFYNTHLIISKKPNSPFPVLLVQISGKKMIIFEKSEQQRVVPNFKDDNLRFDRMIILCSYDGFIVMKLKRNNFSCHIYNPVTREMVIINNSKTRSKFFVYALFFNPEINEYCVILIKEGSYECYDTYEILNLSSPPYLCKPLKTLKGMQKKSCYTQFDHPVVINNANIYWEQSYMWCEQFILSFNIRAEEFCFLPHPHIYSRDQCFKFDRHRNVHIADIHGGLAFVQIEVTDFVVAFNIWTWTAAQESPNWIKTYNVVINVHKFPFRIWFTSRFEVLVIQNGEMLLWHREENIVFAYNLQLGTIRRIRKRHFLDDGCFHYVPSFASLKNFESIICI